MSWLSRWVERKRHEQEVRAAIEAAKARISAGDQAMGDMHGALMRAASTNRKSVRDRMLAEASLGHEPDDESPAEDAIELWRTLAASQDETDEQDQEHDESEETPREK